jgi:hypothetical protein
MSYLFDLELLKLYFLQRIEEEENILKNNPELSDSEKDEILYTILEFKQRIEDLNK